MNRIQPFIIPLLVFGQLLAINYGLLDYARIPRWLYLTVVVSLLICWHAIKGNWSTNRGGASWMPTALLGIWLGSTIASWRSGIDFAEYAAEAGRVTVYFGLFLVLTNQRHYLSEKLFVQAASVAIILTSLFGIWQLVNYNIDFTVVGMEPVTGLMSNKNLFAEYLGIVLPFAVLGLFSSKNAWRVVHGMALVLAIFFILILFTRSVWLGLLLASAVGLFGRFGSFWKTSESVRLLKPISAILGTLLVATVGIDVWSEGAISDRLFSIFEYDVGSAGWRLKTWTATFDMIKESWLTGVGAGNWKIEFQQFGMAKFENTYTTETLNDYIGVFAETGVFGFIGYTGFMVYGLFRSLILVRSIEGTKRRFAIAVLASLTVFAVVSFFNFPKNRIEHMTMALFLVAFSSACHSTVTKGKPRRLSTLLSMVVLPLVVGSGYLAFQRFEAESNVRDALDARKNQEWSQVIKSLEEVNFNTYSMEPSTTPASWYKGLAHFQLAQYDAAYQEFMTAFEVNPYHVHVLNNLATCYELKGEHDKAIELYSEAMRINETFPDALLNLIAVYFNQGRYDEALQIIERSELKENGRVLDYQRLILQAKENATDQE